jgi:colicin import membrane protein
VLLWSVLAFTAGPHRVDSSEMLPVDVISANEFSQITNGAKEAPKAEQPKPLAETIGPAAPVDDPSAKLAKKEVKAANDAPPMPPIPEAKPPEPKVKKPAQPQPDAIAEALKRDEDRRPEPKRADVKPPPVPAPKKQPESPQFDPRKVAALLDKREPQRAAAAGETLNNTPQFGLASANSNTLSQYEMNALRARLQQLWSPPAGARDMRDLSITIRVRLKPDGTLDGQPQLLTSGSGSLFAASSASAVRAILIGQPFTMLRPEHYDIWSEMDLTFDQSMMAGG